MAVVVPFSGLPLGGAVCCCSVRNGSEGAP